LIADNARSSSDRDISIVVALIVDRLSARDRTDQSRIGAALSLRGSTACWLLCERARGSRCDPKLSKISRDAGPTWNCRRTHLIGLPPGQEWEVWVLG